MGSKTLVRVLGSVFLLIFVAISITPSTTRAQSTIQCYVNKAGGGYTPAGTAQNGTCPKDASGTQSFPLGSNGAPGTIGNGNLSYTPLEPLAVNGGTSTDFCGLLNLVFKILIYVGGMVAVVFLVIGGITYMVSEVVSKRGVARDRIKAAVWGLGVLLVSWLVLNAVNPQLVGACNMLAPTGDGVLNGPVGPTYSTVITNQVNDALQTSIDPTGPTNPAYLDKVKLEKPTATTVISVLDIDKLNSGAIIIKNENGVPLDRSTAAQAFAAGCRAQYPGATATSKLTMSNGQQVMICYK
jgi:hypothetical protein